MVANSAPGGRVLRPQSFPWRVMRYLGAARVKGVLAGVIAFASTAVAIANMLELFTFGHTVGAVLRWVLAGVACLVAWRTAESSALRKYRGLSGNGGLFSWRNRVMFEAATIAALLMGAALAWLTLFSTWWQVPGVGYLLAAAVTVGGLSALMWVAVAYFVHRTA